MLLLALACVVLATQRIAACWSYQPFGDKPIAKVGKADIKAVLDTLQAQEKYQTLKKVRNNISQILRYAIDQEMAGVEVDWAKQVHRQYANLALREKHRAAIATPAEVRRLIKAIDGYESSSRLTCLALKFSALTFARPRMDWIFFTLPGDSTMIRFIFFSLRPNSRAA